MPLLTQNKASAHQMTASAHLQTAPAANCLLAMYPAIFFTKIVGSQGNRIAGVLFKYLYINPFVYLDVCASPV